MDEKMNADKLAQEIRRVDGNHSLGAAALAEALMPFIAAHDAQVAQTMTPRELAKRIELGEKWQPTQAAQPKIGDFDARDSFSMQTDTTTLQRNAAQPVGVLDDAPTVQFETKGSPDVAIDLERVSRLSTSDGWVVRVVFRRSDDGRRTTCFYHANEFAAETLHILLAKLTANASLQPKLGEFDARESFSVPTETTTLQRNVTRPAQPSADAEDAARYRWLRAGDDEADGELRARLVKENCWKDLDAAIDAARAGEKGK